MTQLQRRDNGQFEYSLDKMCQCGHTLGLHTADRPYDCGECECGNFRPKPNADNGNKASKRTPDLPQASSTPSPNKPLDKSSPKDKFREEIWKFLEWYTGSPREEKEALVHRALDIWDTAAATERQQLIAEFEKIIGKPEPVNQYSSISAESLEPSVRNLFRDQLRASLRRLGGKK